MNAVRQLVEALRYLFTWWVTVAPWEQAIRVRLGKHVQLLAAGVHLRIPIVDRVYRQSVRRRASTLPAQTLTTKDGRPLTVAALVSYRIADLLLLYETLHHAEQTIAAAVQGAIGGFIVTHDQRECAPAALVQAVGSTAGLERYGLAEVAITLTTFAYVRTYRLITGEGVSWGHGDHLDTDREDGAREQPS